MSWQLRKGVNHDHVLITLLRIVVLQNPQHDDKVRRGKCDATAWPRCTDLHTASSGFDPTDTDAENILLQFIEPGCLNAPQQENKVADVSGKEHLAAFKVATSKQGKVNRESWSVDMLEG